MTIAMHPLCYVQPYYICLYAFTLYQLKINTKEHNLSEVFLVLCSLWTRCWSVHGCNHLHPKHLTSNHVGPRWTTLDCSSPWCYWCVCSQNPRTNTHQHHSGWLIPLRGCNSLHVHCPPLMSTRVIEWGICWCDVRDVRDNSMMVWNIIDIHVLY